MNKKQINGINNFARKLPGLSGGSKTNHASSTDVVPHSSSQYHGYKTKSTNWIEQQKQSN